MSPVAVGSTTVLNNGGPTMNDTSRINGVNGNGAGVGKGGGKSNFPHIDDLLHVDLGVDKTCTIERCLSAAEDYLRSGESLAEWGRPDQALKEYMRSYSIAVEVIAAHHDFLTFQSDRRKLGERYATLLRGLGKNDKKFQTIKAEIKADNARSGVQPTMHRGTGLAKQSRPPSTVNTDGKNERHGMKRTHAPIGEPGKRDSIGSRPSGIPPPAASPGRAKPAPKPKPVTLHGKAIKSGVEGPGRSSQDLDVRFAQLRSTPSTPIQDPRIRTQPIPHDRPAGPRPMPSSRPSIDLDTNAHNFPKKPDAIYNPARGSTSREAAELPSSTPRGMYSRANSITGHSNPSITNIVNSSSTTLQRSPSVEDYFATTPSYGLGMATSRKRSFSLPPSNEITVEELVKYQKIGSKGCRILLIDVRSRDDFDLGHIMSSATICVEPEVLERDGISAQEIAEAIIIAPNEEHGLFEARHDFDMVVFYDQDSESTVNSKPLSNLFYALTTYDFPGQDSGSKHPKLLKGGLEAWTDVMGRNLQASTTLNGTGIKPSKPARRRASSFVPQPNKPRKASKPIQNLEEARMWEQNLTPHKDAETIDQEDDAEIQFVRNTDDFVRRYPTIDTIQESMVSPAIKEDHYNNRLLSRSPAHPPDIYTSLPSPPARPPPAVPRPSYTGFQALNDDQTSSTKVIRRPEVKPRKRAVGLVNPHNWCYANSSLQSLYGSTGFADELMSGDWQKLYVPPKKADETIPPPQLMTKMMANLFYWMGNGRWNKMEAKTLMQYCHHITQKDANGKRRPEAELFGGRNQQDAQEFMSFLITELHDETNIYRDRPSSIEQPSLDKGKSIFQAALDYWRSYSWANASIVDKYWRGLSVVIVQCRSCRHSTASFQAFDLLVLNTPPDDDSASLDGMLREYFTEELLDDYTCDNCKSKGHSYRHTKLARLPDLLCICFSRFGTDERGHDRKIMTPVDFPIKNMDLSRYSIPQNPHAGGLIDHHFTGPFNYDAYAVVQHSGQVNSGHYISMIKDDQPSGTTNSDVTLWHKANDETITSLDVGASKSHAGTKRLFGEGNFTSYLAFYERTNKNGSAGFL